MPAARNSAQLRQAFTAKLRRDLALAVVRMGRRQALDGVAHPVTPVRGSTGVLP